MTEQAPAPSSWGWNPDTIQFCFVAALLAAAVARQVISWISGYQRYGLANLTLCRGDRTYKPNLARLAMRCPGHIARTLHPDEVHDTNPMKYEKHRGDEGLVVRPVAVSTRHWSYDAVEADRIGWAKWLGVCLWLALHKRFREPRVDPCHYC